MNKFSILLALFLDMISAWSTLRAMGFRHPIRNVSSGHIHRYLSSLSGAKDSSTSYSSSCSCVSALSLEVTSVEDMEEVGSLLSTILFMDDSNIDNARGVAIYLEGDLGAGKTALARGFVRGATDDWNLRVTSPTYLLSNTYKVATSAASDVSEQRLE